MKGRRILWKRVILGTLGILLLVGAFYVYFKTGFFTIKTYEIVGADVKHVSELNSIFLALDKQKLYKILPGNRVLSFHKHQMKKEILNLLSNTSAISIYPVSNHTIKIKISSYEPLFSYYDDKHIFDMTVPTEYEITKEGIIYKRLDGSPSPKFGATLVANASSTAYVNSALLNDLSDLVPKISSVLFPVSQIYIDEYGDIYMRAYVYEAGPYVIFSSKNDSKRIWSNLVSAIDTDPLKSKLLNNKEGLEYIDTRFGNKVFYKFTPLDKSSIDVTKATSTIRN
jgi:hypothetical protein